MGALLWLSSIGSVACIPPCPPLRHDDVYPLDKQPDAGASLDAHPDADASSDAAPDGPATERAPPPPGTTSDGAAPDGSIRPIDSGVPFRLNCGFLAEGCTPGQSCPAACDCVVNREGMTRSPMTIIDGCVLAAGTTVPSVEVRSHLVVGCE